MLSRIGQWTVAVPLPLLLGLCVAFQGALLATIIIRNDALFYAGVIGSWALIIILLIRQFTILGSRMTELFEKKERMGSGELAGILFPLALQFCVFAILSTVVGISWGVGL